MKIPGFEQTVMEMFGHKTNYVGLGMVIYGAYLLITGNFDAGMAFIGTGSGLMTLKDGQIKAGR